MLRRLLEEHATWGIEPNSKLLRPLFTDLARRWTQMAVQHEHSALALRYAVDVIEWMTYYDTFEDAESLLEPLAQLCVRQHDRATLLDAWEAFSSNSPPESDNVVYSLLNSASIMGGNGLVNDLGEIMGATLRHGLSNESMTMNDQHVDDITNLATEPRQVTTLSDFEAQSLLQRMVQSIQEADASDEDKVVRLVKNWQGFDTDTELNVPLLSALVEYYSRIGDIKAAMSWLRRTQSMVDVRTETVLLQLARIIRALSKSDQPQASYRMEELLLQAQDLSTDDCPVDDELYKITAQKWLSSQDRRRTDRAQANVLSMREIDGDSIDLLFEVVKLSGSASEDCVERLFDVAARSCKAVDTDHTVLEKVSTVFGQAGAWEASLKLIEAMKAANIVPDAALSSSLVHSMKKEPQQMFTLIDELTSTGVRLSMDIYEDIIRVALEDLVGAPNQAQRVSVTRKVLQDIFDESPYASRSPSGQASIQRIVCSALAWIAESRREKDAYDLLVMAEKYAARDDSSGHQCHLPLDCFTSVAQALATKNKSGLIQDMLERLLQYQQNGSDHLALNAKFCAFYMSSLASSGNKSLEQQRRALDMLVGFYRTKRDNAFKPTDRMYNGILSIFRNNANEENATEMERLIDEMVELRIDLKDDFTLATALEILVKANAQPVFARAIKLQKKLKHSPRGFHSWSLLLSACFRARVSEREEALRICLEAVEGLHELEGRLSPKTYDRVFRLLHSLRVENEKVAARLYEMCCSDGALTGDIAQAAKSLVSPPTWQHLNKNVQFSEKWTRHGGSGRATFA